MGHDKPNLPIPTKSKRWMPLAGMALLLASLMTTGCVDRLTPDQVMIDNFKKNKPAFQELVISYLQFPPPNNGEWDKLPRVIELKKMTGIKDIDDGPGYWFDDPYSLEAAQKLHEMDENKSWKQFHGRKPAIISMPMNKGYDNYTKLYAIYMKEAEDWFKAKNAYNGQWDKLPTEFKDALLVTFVNLGEKKMTEFMKSPDAMGYQPSPGLLTAGGMNHLLNISDIGSAMGIAGYGDGVVSVSDMASLARENSIQ